MNIKIRKTPKGRVASGARWLDQYIPDWYERARINNLNMADTCRCVLGQVFEAKAREESLTSGFGFGSRVVEAETNVAACELGFDIYADETYHELAELWTTEIEKRKGEAS